MKRNVHVALLIFILAALIILFNNTFAPIYYFSGLTQNLFSFPKSFLYNGKVFALSKFNPEDHGITKIREENKKILEKLADYETLKKENQTLRLQFENENTTSLHLVMGHIVGFSGKYDAPTGLVVNVGTDRGVKKGNGVLVEKNLVGVVDDVSKSYSHIIVPLHKDFSIVGKTLKSNAVGILKGEEDFMLFDKVSITDKLDISEVVVTKGDLDISGSGIPPDMVVGKIVWVNKIENKPFQNAKVQPVIDYSRIETVFVVSAAK